MFCVSFSKTDSSLCIYHLFVWWNFNLLHNSEWISSPTQLYLLLHSFCASLLHLLKMWLVVSSLSSLSPTLAIFLRIVNFFFDMINPYGIILCYYYIIYPTYEHSWVCLIPHKYVGHYCESGEMRWLSSHHLQRLPFSRRWRVLYFVIVIKISI